MIIFTNMGTELTTAIVGAAGLLIGGILTFILGNRKVNLSAHDSWRADFEQLVRALREDNESLRSEVASLKELVEKLHQERMHLTKEVASLKALVNHLESQ